MAFGVVMPAGIWLRQSMRRSFLSAPSPPIFQPSREPVAGAPALQHGHGARPVLLAVGIAVRRAPAEHGLSPWRRNANETSHSTKVGVGGAQQADGEVMRALIFAPHVALNSGGGGSCAQPDLKLVRRGAFARKDIGGRLHDRLGRVVGDQAAAELAADVACVPGWLARIQHRSPSCWPDRWDVLPKHDLGVLACTASSKTKSPVSF